MKLLTKLMLLMWTLTLFLVVYDYGYSNGKDSAKCDQRHGYNYPEVKWFKVSTNK